MRTALLTREYPPEVYGGAGVHVAHLAAALGELVEVDVHCFGADRVAQESGPTIHAYQPWERLVGTTPMLGALRAVSVDLSMAAGLQGADIVHSHTWYTNLGGHLAKLLFDVPHVVTVHSLEPKRPWKADQLGAGHRVSTWCEQTGLEYADGVIAVSRAAARDVTECYPEVDPERITVIPNAVDPCEFRPDPATDVLERHGIDPARPIVFCAARITRQKGIRHLVDAARRFDASVQLVLRIGAADTPELAAEIGSRVEALAAERDGVVWIREGVDDRALAQLLSHATVVCVPSVYEPFGLVNLEAMACEAPVVATSVGGIPEVVEDGTTGILVGFEPSSPTDPQPADPGRFTADLAAAICRLIEDPETGRKMGEAGRRRVVEHFSWPAVAARTVALYGELLGTRVLPTSAS